jgi:hypothetical protein
LPPPSQQPSIEQPQGLATSTGCKSTTITKPGIIMLIKSDSLLTA